MLYCCSGARMYCFEGYFFYAFVVSFPNKDVLMSKKIAQFSFIKILS